MTDALAGASTLDAGSAPRRRRSEAERHARVLRRARAQGLEYDGWGPIHSIAYSTDGPFARWVYFFEQDKWVLLK